MPKPGDKILFHCFFSDRDTNVWNLAKKGQIDYDAETTV